MDDKDRQIQELFDGYADGLAERPDLASKARAQLTEKLVDKNGRETRRAAAHPKRRAVFIGVASLAAAAVVGVFALGVLPKLLVGGSGIPPASDGSPSSPMPDVAYSLGDVRAVSVSAEFAEAYIDLTEVKAQSAVFDEHYYACYIEYEQVPVYVRGVFGVETPDGITEMSVIAERDGYRRDDLEKSYNGLITPSGYYMYYNNYDKGEYVTMAYFAARGYNYYVYAQSGAGFSDGLIQNLL